MIILTGGAGFIGSNLLKELNKQQVSDIVIVDDIDHPLKAENLVNSKYKEIVPINNFFEWVEQNKNLSIDVIFHLGACSDTLEKDKNYLYENNVVYSQKLWQLAIKQNSKFIYASSAATYGDGSLGFSDDHSLVPNLKPLNLYGESKQEFDLWVLKQLKTPPLWVGLKYFNVFGPGEAHKGRMASVIWHFINQLKNGEDLKLFGPSHGFKAGEQKRDFIYVQDAVNMTIYAQQKKIPSGIYNVGTGIANTFNELASAIITIIGKKKVEYIPFPKDLIINYQAFTCADMTKFKRVNYLKKFLSITNGVGIYLNIINNR
jgi:ADP-L-glycero-D-manno-heptose 6-epimerase